MATPLETFTRTRAALLAQRGEQQRQQQAADLAPLQRRQAELGIAGEEQRQRAIANQPTQAQKIQQARSSAITAQGVDEYLKAETPEARQQVIGKIGEIFTSIGDQEALANLQQIAQLPEDQQRSMVQAMHNDFVQRGVLQKPQTAKPTKSPLGAPITVTGPDGKPTLVQRNTETGKLVPVEGFSPSQKVPLVKVEGDAPAETEEQKAFGRTLGKKFDRIIQDGQSASEDLTLLDSLDLSLANPDVNTGPAANFGLGLISLANQLGVKVNEEKLSAGEGLRSVTSQLALRMGENLKGSTSERDLQFMKQATAGLGQSREGNLLMAWKMRKAVERRMDIASEASEFREKHGTIAGFDDHIRGWGKANPMFTDEEVAAVRAGKSPIGLSEAPISDDVTQLSDEDLFN